MTSKDPKQKPQVESAINISLYDLFDNPNGPSFNELWESFANRRPIIAGKVLDYANECARQGNDPSIAESILLGAVKTASYFDDESELSPEGRQKSAAQLRKLFPTATK